MRHQNWAVDSKPVGRFLQESWDYSGLQVYGLTGCTLANALDEGLAALEGSGDGKEYRVFLSPSLRWSDGSRITASDFLRGIQAALASNRLIAAILFRDVRSVRNEDDALKFVLSKPDFRFSSVIRLPQFAPWHASDRALSSGPYVLLRPGDGEWAFRRNDYFSGGDSGDDLPDSARVVLVQDPNRNLALYEENQIAITADTAFPFDRLKDYENRPDLIRGDTGLSFSLAFGRRLCGASQAALRRGLTAVVNAAADLVCRSVMGGATRPVRFESAVAPESVVLPRGSLVLAYDDYYPNRDLCGGIQQALEKRGAEVELQVDDFHSPFIRYDLKLVISRGASPEAYTRFASLLALGPFVSNIEYRRTYLEALRRWGGDPDPSHQPAHVASLCGILTELAAVVPLAACPSIFLKRDLSSNPLLRQLRGPGTEAA